MKDSGNSGTPPSKEPMKSEVERRTKSLRQKSDNPVGGQKGHEGTTRQMVANPDEIENVQAPYCQECGRDLSGVTGELEYVTQEIDLSLIMAIYRERRFYKKVCTWGCCNRGYESRRKGGNHYYVRLFMSGMGNRPRLSGQMAGWTGLMNC